MALSPDDQFLLELLSKHHLVWPLLSLASYGALAIVSKIFSRLKSTLTQGFAGCVQVHRAYCECVAKCRENKRRFLGSDSPPPRRSLSQGSREI